MGSLFDGIGGFPLAAQHNGIEPLWASEIAKFSMKVTSEKFPKMIHVGDITKLNGASLPIVDIICGGSPCQDLSIAGQRRGLAGERSGLFMEQVRIVKEMRKVDEEQGVSDYLVRPRYLVWENVPGAFSSTGGEDFRAVIEEIVHIKDSACHVPRPDSGKWGPAGAAILGHEFSLAWRVLDAQFWGVPQRRRRIFLVADFGGLTAIQILFKQESLFEYPAACRSAEAGAAGGIKGCIGDAGWCSNEIMDKSPELPEISDCFCIAGNVINRKIQNGGNGFGCQKNISYTLTCMDCHAVYCGEMTLQRPEREKSIRYLTPLECERLQGFPDGWTLVPGASDDDRYTALGNSVAIPCVDFILRGIAYFWHQIYDNKN